MAVVSTLKDDPEKYGAFETRVVDFTLDASYPTGGWAISLDDLDLTAVIMAVFEPTKPGATTTGALFHYDRTNNKLQVFVSNGAAPARFAELANTTDISAIGPIRAIVYGRL